MIKQIIYKTANAFGVLATYPVEFNNLPDIPQIPNCAMQYIELVHKSTGEVLFVEEFTDELFFEGYRFGGYVPNSYIDYPELYASQQDAANERLLNSATDPMIRVTEERISGESMYHQPVEIW